MAERPAGDVENNKDANRWFACEIVPSKLFLTGDDAVKCEAASTASGARLFHGLYRGTHA